MSSGKETQTHTEYRTRIFVVCGCLFALVAITRLAYLQIAQGSAYAAKAENQYVPASSPTFSRGSVFMRDKNGELSSFASLEEFYTLAIQPRAIQSKDTLFTKLTEYGVRFEKEEVVQKLLKTDDPYEEIAKNVPKKNIDALKKENIKGLIYVKNFRRLYPQGTVGSQVIGFVGNNGTKVTGQYGIERSYESLLERTSAVPVNVFADVFADINDTLDSRVVKEDADIILTLEPAMQNYLHDILADTKAKWGSSLIGGIIMNPKTGEIIAMDSLPSFDPNNFGEYAQSRYINPNVESVYELGSIIKPLTVAAGLDAGVISEQTQYNDTGFLMLSGYRVSNFDRRARGVVPIQKILDQSLNVGATFVQQRIGRARFSEYFLEKYSMGEKTNIELPNEVKSLTKNLSSREEVNYATASFGQGIALTPIAAIRALATLGNGGVLVEPYIVKEIVYKDGRIEKEVRNEPRRAISKEASETITRMLVKTVDNALLGGTKKINDYAVAAKTGTAEMAARDGGYRSDAFLHSFFAYFPAYDPDFIVLLYQLEPNSKIGASETLTDPAFSIVSYALSYYNVPPDRK
jgi:stage V sporulation protein D (sporulation-specific penicillin-binding protein)